MKAFQESHIKEYKEPPQVVVRVPDVTTILGEFAYYSQGKALMCTNARCLYVALSESTDSQVHIYNTFTKDKKRFALSSLKYRKEDKWGNYVKGIFHQLNEMGVGLKTFNITLDGPVLRDGSANLAALVSVGICFALKEALGLSLDAKEMGVICHRNCIQYCGELYRYSTIMAVLNARAGKYFLFDLNTLSFSYLDDPFDNGLYSMVAIDCKINQNAMREEFSLRHREALAAFSRLRELTSRISIKDFPISDLSNRVVPLDEASRRLCSDILEKNGATQAMQRLFMSRDYMQIGKVLSRMALIARDDMELTCPEIDWLVKRSSEIPECLGSFSVLDGDNSQVAIVIENSAEAMGKLQAKLDDYERIFGFKAMMSSVVPKGPCSLAEVE
ncbi:MAG: hypothetical protein IJ863_08910 [Spirochaetales bacterium]|nr:hypothetical protein [Spirochaetales bacterium]